MKIYLLFVSTLLISLTGYSLKSDSTGMSGDNLDLNAVMELFKDSKSVEDFENQLNSEKNEVNNLDLNDDGFVDYIRIIDYNEGDVHSLTLQVPYSDSEAQDVAVIEIEKTDDDNTVAQIVGDEDLYGTDYIVEPQTDDENTAANVHKWKSVRYIYAPKYVAWVSPYRHRHYPAWYKPWKPVIWGTYYGRMRHHHVNYRRTHHHRCVRAHAHYQKHRSHSPTFHKHHPHHAHKRPVKKTGIKKTGNQHVKQQVKPGNKGQKHNVAPKTTTQPNQGVKKKSQSSPPLKSTMSKPTKRPGGTRKAPAAKPKSGSGRPAAKPKSGGGKPAPRKH